ncbi:MAG: MnhB domain-containing protein [Candidatus Stygibacter australis]|nr:MnhB domain-containing protein [Candidatus Stygibacter australis]MDP8322388.1 MnhB domain-containing protein [Candidatus Stygibacter australis]
MIKRFFSLFFVILLLFVLLPLVTDIKPLTELGITSQKYARDGAKELGAANLVTSVVVTYRGLDTLGEVTVLFITTAGIGFLLRKRSTGKNKKRKASEILKSGTSFLLPLIVLFGVYIFTHGHLTPGGGFQGGVVIASAIVLLLLSDINLHTDHNILNWLESLSGAFYILLGILGLILAGGFLDNRFLPLGEFGKIFSAGAIPIIYSLIGLKVGAELVGILSKLGREE